MYFGDIQCTKLKVLVSLNVFYYTYFNYTQTLKTTEMQALCGAVKLLPTAMIEHTYCLFRHLPPQKKCIVSLIPLQLFPRK